MILQIKNLDFNFRKYAMIWITCHFGKNISKLQSPRENGDQCLL